ncbi:MAG TPA: ABC transporter permease [Candidatus Andersenbacteria bacterium]|nr:ABC transporter permease [Candidatus Andersenbacteria bacterium]
MNLTSTIKTSIRALRANWGRSLLTILGIVIGVMAIVLVISLGQGAQNLILSQVQSIGANTIILRPGRQPTQPSDAASTLLTDSLKQRDVDALLKPINVPDLEAADPAVLVPGSVSYQNSVYQATVLGWTPNALGEVFHVYPEQGAFFTQDDVRSYAKVIVIGSKVKQELFGESDALGQFVTVHGQKLQVVGILPAKGQVTAFNIDDIGLIPYTTAQKTLLGIDYFHEIFLRAKPGANVDQVAADVTTTLREMHNITDPAKDDFFVVTQKTIVATVSTVTQVLTIFLVAIASISLMVGGIGIMNIMLVSVTERTQEIGLRKALGATNRNILLQFMIEAIMLTFAGGLLGTLIAITISALVSTIAQTYFALDWPFTLPIGAIVLGVGVSTAIGMIFGLYPARKAAAKDPIEALRFE